MMSYKNPVGRCFLGLMVVVCAVEVAQAGRWWRARSGVPARQAVAAPVAQNKPVQLPTTPSQSQFTPVQPPAVRAPAPPQRPQARPVRYGRSIITFDNQSGQQALVKLVGPTRAKVNVPNGTHRAIQRVAAGNYVIRVRYGTPGNYRYLEGDAFYVVGTSASYSRISITLHSVAYGIYGTRPISAGEFASDTP